MWVGNTANNIKEGSSTAGERKGEWGKETEGESKNETWKV
jgi:hypothetical protein